MLDLLASKGADLNARTNTGTTLAHAAARNGNSCCLKVLCERGADVDVVNHLGNTPTMFAAMAGDVNVSFLFPTILLPPHKNKHAVLLSLENGVPDDRLDDYCPFAG